MTYQQRDELAGARLALTGAETARAIGVSLRTLFTMIERGGGPPFIDLNPHGRKRILRFPVHELRRWLSERAAVGHKPTIRMARPDAVEGGLSGDAE